MTNDLKRFAIVADVGGTFARFARVDLSNFEMDKIEIYTCAEFSSFELVLTKYRLEHALEEIKRVSIAIASPIKDDLVTMTNCNWHFSIAQVKQQFDFSTLQVINDFKAIALSITALAPDDFKQIGTGHSINNQIRVVLGAGTGLGVAYLVPSPLGYIAYSGEGGHADWGAKTNQEWFIYQHLKKTFDHVSLERLLSGQGLEHIYLALGDLNHQAIQPQKAAEIISLAQRQQCKIAQQTIDQFFAILAGYAGDLALTFGALGGVYIAGGIVPRLLPLMQQSKFRSDFENKGRFADFNAQIPIYVITAEQPGILGAAVHLKQTLQGEFNVIS